MKLFLALCVSVFVCQVDAKSKITGSSAQTQFKKCHSTFSSATLTGRNKDLCFEAVPFKFVVQVGTPGTNDDVFVTLCSDVDAKQCCKTPALKAAFSDDWSKEDREEWKDSYFGKCKNFKMKVKRGLQVTLSKSNDGPLQVKKMTVLTRSPDPKKVPDVESFQCGTFLLGNKRGRTQTNNCKTGPYHYMKIHSMNVTMGNDGTDDNVKVKVCSDATDFCCEQKISKLLYDNWRKGDTQRWKASAFGDCAKLQFKVNDHPRISVIKDGRDSLVVNTLTFNMIRQDENNKLMRYSCGGFSFKNECATAAQCTKLLPCKLL